MGPGGGYTDKSIAVKYDNDDVKSVKKTYQTIVPCMMTLVAQRFALWALNEGVMGFFPGRTKLGYELL